MVGWIVLGIYGSAAAVVAWRCWRRQRGWTRLAGGLRDGSALVSRGVLLLTRPVWGRDTWSVPALLIRTPAGRIHVVYRKRGSDRRLVLSGSRMEVIDWMGMRDYRSFIVFTPPPDPIAAEDGQRPELPVLFAISHAWPCIQGRRTRLLMAALTRLDGRSAA